MKIIKGNIHGELILDEDTEIIGDIMPDAKIVPNGYKIFLTGGIYAPIRNKQSGGNGGSLIVSHEEKN